MIRPLTCVCMLMAGGAGLYLYQVKHRAQLLDRQIEHTMAQTEAAHERTRMLRAEWALLNEPERLQDLAEHFLHLKPMAPAQFAQMSDLANRLPVPGSGKPADSTDGDDDDAALVRGSDAPGRPQTAAVQQQRAPVSPPVPVPLRQAAAMPPHRNAERHTMMAEASRTKPAHVQSAAITPHVVPLAMPRPVAAGVLNAMATRPLPRPQMQLPISYAAAAPTIGTGGSVLGMARGLLPPPAPVAMH